MRGAYETNVICYRDHRACRNHAGTSAKDWLIYRASGVFDNGGFPRTGPATVVHCTNFDLAAATVQFRIWQFNGITVADQKATLASRETFTVTTKDTNMFYDNLNLNTGLVNQGSLIINATSQEVKCSAMLVNAATGEPAGVALHLVRSNPSPGTQE